VYQERGRQLPLSFFLDKQKERCRMSAWLIAFTGLIYAYVALEQGLKGNTGMFIAYMGYSFSNIGLFMLASK